ncbi:hypothetical protein MYK68_15830 [Gordonia sp. PP30]|uniref:hypothetical protein n=1 Tax=Gordonia sp. PP30 TaxID=2935861 RepID=UPI001FFE9C63|nr:hypothetical protein [Gordonia sp. PP30]UQE74182.1 hypothetical protein MYK68_15830 [Gordonia sp. PP30]
MADVLDVTLEDPPDGQWWPQRFAADVDWCDDRGAAWRAVTNYPKLQARRRGDVLDLRTIGTTDIHSYDLALTAISGQSFYIATERTD